VPLLAGSAGGYYSGTSYSGFSGGGVQISSATSIIIRNVGLINAGGAGAYGGGGSGGAILLEAPTVTVQGTLARMAVGVASTARSAGGDAEQHAGGRRSERGRGLRGPDDQRSLGVIGDAGTTFYGGGGGVAGTSASMRAPVVPFSTPGPSVPT